MRECGGEESAKHCGGERVMEMVTSWMGRV